MKEWRDCHPETIPDDIKQMQVIPRWEEGSVRLFVEYDDGETTHSRSCYSIAFGKDRKIFYNFM